MSWTGGILSAAKDSLGFYAHAHGRERGRRAGGKYGISQLFYCL